MGRDKKQRTVNVAITLSGDEEAVIKTATAIAVGITAIAPEPKRRQAANKIRTALAKLAKRKRAPKKTGGDLQ